MTDETKPPRDNDEWIGDPATEAFVRDAIDRDSFSHGWLLAGPQGVGKATFAYRAAKAVLAKGDLIDDKSLATDPKSKTAHLVSSSAHPDLFVAERRFDEKKGRTETEIPVDTIRRLTAFLSRTASMSKWRVAIVDKADDLNRNAANALLKVLEEPPKNTLLLLVCDAPGRIIPTIRSRCRRLDFRRLEDREIRAFLEGAATDPSLDRSAIVAAAQGRPGLALTLASEDGAAAVDAANTFISKARGEAVLTIAQSLSGKAGEARWPIFRSLVLDALSREARDACAETPRHGVFSHASAPQLVAAWEDLSDFIDRGDRLNLDRAQIILAMQRRLARALEPETGIR